MQRRYASLDALRAYAIISVFIAHTVLAYGAPGYLAPLQLGGSGVDLFFVLSGWLLGNQLFKEIEKTGTIELRRFWSRRWLRTLPAYYAVLVATLLQRFITKDDANIPVSYFLFLQNYLTDLDFFYISWSLCVEEQFYLFIAPFLIGLLRLNKNKWSIVILIVLITPEIFRLLGWYSKEVQTHIRISPCIAGVWLACIRNFNPRIWQKACQYAAPLALLGIFSYILFFINRWYSLGLPEPTPLMLSVVFGSWVFICNSSDAWRNKLDFPGIHYIATRSYAIYLLHPESYALMKYLPLELNFMLYFIFSATVTAGLAEILYRAVEIPFMNMRERFQICRQIKTA